MSREYINYKDKDGVDYSIWKTDAVWLRNHAPLLQDESANNILNFFILAIKTKQNYELENIVDVFTFVRTHSSMPLLEKANNIDWGDYSLDYDKLIQYVEKSDIDRSFHNPHDTDIETFVDIFTDNWSLWATPSGISFNQPYDSLIIAHRASGIDIQAILIWYIVFNYAIIETNDDPDWIAQYVLKYADDPDFLN